MSRKTSIVCGLVAAGVIALSYAYFVGSIVEPETVSQQIDISDAHLKGNPTATVTLIEFADYQCPYCAQYEREIGQQLHREYISTGKVQLAYLHFPLPKHLQALQAAEAAECAGDQGKYWEMHDLLFLDGGLELQDLMKNGRQLGLDSDRFQNCIVKGFHWTKIAHDHGQGMTSEVDATPTFYIGKTTQGVVSVTERFTGVMPYRSLRRALDKALASVELASR